MGIIQTISKFNLVAIICMMISILTAGLIILSMFLPWAENRESLNSVGICNAIFPPLFDKLLQKSCTNPVNGEIPTNKWTDSLFKGTDYVVSALLFVTLIMIFFSIIYDFTQLFRKTWSFCNLPLQFRYLNVISFIILFGALHLYILLFFFDAQKMNQASGGSLIEVGSGFWTSFIASLFLLLSGFIDVVFSSPSRQRKGFL